MIKIVLQRGAVILILVAGSSHASLIEFNVDGFMDSTGTVSNGMPWGIVVDTGGGFAAQAYTAVPSAGDGFLSTLSGVTTDYYLAGGTDILPSWGVTLDNSGPGPSSGPGGLMSTLEYTFRDGAPVSSGSSFQLIWSDSSHYGTLTSSSFVLGSPTDNLEFEEATAIAAGMQGQVANVQFAAVPEPSSALLLALISATMIFVRKRR